MLVLLGAVCGMVSAAELPGQERLGLLRLVQGREQPLGDIFVYVCRCRELLAASHKA